MSSHLRRSRRKGEQAVSDTIHGRQPPGQVTVGSRQLCRAAVRWALLLTVGLIPSRAPAQDSSLQGIVTSAQTGSPLEGVAIVLERGGEQAYGTLTDRNGFYQIGAIEEGPFALRGQYIAHVQHLDTLIFTSGSRRTVNFVLQPNAVALEGVVVSGERGATVRDLGRQRVTPADLRLVPVPAGSGDLASYLQTLPGVTTTGDRGGQLFVRGGTPAENLVLVDGIPIYQPFHILGFFSVFPEDLVSSVDFYAGGFGSRYSGRTSAVLDVAMRDGDPARFRGTGSISPLLAEAVAEGPAGAEASWIVAVRRSLIEETSEALLGAPQPIAFESQFFKLTATAGDNLRCSALALHTDDHGRLDPEERDSEVGWENLVFGGRCVAQLSGFFRLLEANFSHSSIENVAVSRGSSKFRSGASRMQHNAHVTSMIRSIPLYAGYHLYSELMDHDLAEIYGMQEGRGAVFGLGGYLETSLTVGSSFELRPGIVVTGAPHGAAEPRIRASWEPLGGAAGRLQSGLGLYRQDVLGTSDMRDVGSVFTAWMQPPDDIPLEALHAALGWEHSVGGGLRWSVEGYYKRLRNIPVPVWRGVTQFTTRLQRANGETHGADARVELTRPGFYGFVGYGYGWTEYEAAQKEFGMWFGEPVQAYHPPHDRRHQVNVLGSLELGGFRLASRWQFGTGLPFTRPLGFDEAFDYTLRLHDPSTARGVSRLVLDRPYTARLPLMHRLDLSVEREVDLSFASLTAQVGAINAYDRRNMFYYDLYSARRVDQLPLAPYASLTLRSH